jgi:hypothetical protein
MLITNPGLPNDPKIPYIRKATCTGVRASTPQEALRPVIHNDTADHLCCQIAPAYGALVNHCFCPAAQASLFRQDAIHVLFSQPDKDLKGRFGTVDELSSSRQKDHATVTGTVSPPDELGSAIKGVFAQVGARDAPVIVGAKVQPRSNVDVGAEVESQSTLGVLDLFD